MNADTAKQILNIINDAIAKINDVRAGIDDEGVKFEIGAISGTMAQAAGQALNAYMEAREAEIVAEKKAAAEAVPQVKKFEVGKTYETRHAGDHELKYRCTVVKRTDKTVWIQHNGRIVSRRVKVWTDREVIEPEGHYSMCLVVGADKEAQA